MLFCLVPISVVQCPYCPLWSWLEKAVPNTGQFMVSSHTGQPCSPPAMKPLPFMPHTILKVNRKKKKKASSKAQL